MDSSCPLCLQAISSPIVFSDCDHKCCFGCVIKIVFYNHLKLFEMGDTIEIDCLK